MTGRRRHRQASMTAFFAPAKSKDDKKKQDSGDENEHSVDLQRPTSAPTECTLTPPSPPISSPEREEGISLPPSSISVPEQPSTSVPDESTIGKNGIRDESFALPNGFPPTKPLPQGNKENVLNHFGLGQVTLAGCNIPPSRVCYVSIPFKQVSIPPGAPPLHSPITPDQIRAKERPEPVVCEGLAEEPSRLCRARNLARRSYTRAKQTEVESIESDDSSEPPISRPRKRKKALHPFFANTTAAVNESKEKKRPRVVKATYDPWNFEGATRHVNVSKPDQPWFSPPTLSGRDVEVQSGVVMRTSTANRPYYGDVKKPVGVANVGADLWVEKYKVDKRTDVISASVTKELVDWLRPWYSKSTALQESDLDSCSSWVDEIVGEDLMDMERIAVIQGGVGCGKSTIVANAARQLGLTILEINSSVCRTGRKVRDIVQEALRTHRVAGKSDAGSKKSGTASAKTLILFEEVDGLHEDERGFWHTLQELTTSSECRRPIVCTVNKFNSDLRTHFVEEKGSTREDLERLVVGVKEELVNNPLPYKHLRFIPRNERQVSAVLSRVIESEQIVAHKDTTHCLALLCRNDARKAINLLHFWGLKGLSNEAIPKRLSGFPMLSIDEQANRALQMISGIATSSITSSVFWTAAKEYADVSSTQRKSSRLSKRKPKPAWADPLPTWSDTLDLMSSADIVRGMAHNMSMQGGAGAESFTLDLHYDTDINLGMNLAEDLDLAAMEHAKDHLLFETSNEGISEVARDMELAQVTQTTLMSGEYAVPRRAVYSEYLPALRTMARCHGKSATKNVSKAETSTRERGIRRTRASLRKGGFAALDLDPLTVSDLQTSSLLR